MKPKPDCVTPLFPDNRFSDLRPDDLNPSEQDAVISLTLAILRQRHEPGRKLDQPDTARQYFQLKLSEYQNEQFGILFLDNRHRIVADEILFQGTVNGCSVHSRVVAQRALALNASAVMLYHNHPSGVCEPSSADKTITTRLVDALRLLDVRVLDHFIVSATETFSFAESGLL